MSNELCKWLLEHKPSEQDIKDFKQSVREQEEQFRETTRRLTPTAKDRSRYFNI